MQVTSHWVEIIPPTQVPITYLHYSESWSRVESIFPAKNTVFLRFEAELTVYFLQKHSVSEIWSRVDSLFPAKTQYFRDLKQSWQFISCSNTSFRNLKQSWQFISCKNTVFLSSEPELRVYFLQQHKFSRSEAELTVYFLQKHSVSEIWSRVDSLFPAETQCFRRSEAELTVYFLQKHSVFGDLKQGPALRHGAEMEKRKNSSGAATLWH